MAQISVAWVLAKEHVTAPIVGTTRLESLKETIGELNVLSGCDHALNLSILDAVNIKLTEDEIKYLEEPYVPQAIIGQL